MHRSSCALPVIAIALVTFVAFAGLPCSATSAPAEAPRVRLIATGGTISARAGARFTAEDLVKLVPDLEKYARVETEQFANVASSQLTLDQWLRLGRRINELFAADKDLAGIVVTSGTDTLEETAYFLHLVVKSDRPVALVGAMRNPNTIGYEGPANLLEGFRVAADPASRGKGVLVVLNDEINGAREVTKTDALRLQTFQSRPAGVLGVVDADRVVYYRESVKRHTTESEFDIAAIETLPRVDVIMAYQGASGDLIKAAVDNGARGIVIAGVGAGGTSGTQRDGISYATAKGVFIVTSTRTGSGRVAPRRGGRAPDDRERTPEEIEQIKRSAAHELAAEDLAPVKARILLMLALTRTQKAEEIQRMFSEY